MFVAVVFLAAFLAAVSADPYFAFGGAYCSKTMTTLAGTSTSAIDCGNKCKTSNNKFKYANFVPSSGQCLCSEKNTDRVINSNTDCWALDNWCPLFTKCAPSSAWGENADIVTQAGTYYCAPDCALKCKAGNFKYFNYVENPYNGGSGQCQCLKTNKKLYAMGSTVSAYSLGTNSCTVGATPTALRQ